MRLIRNDRPLIMALDEMSGARVTRTRAAREVMKRQEEKNRRDRALIEALEDLARNDPDALRAVDVK